MKYEFYLMDRSEPTCPYCHTTVEEWYRIYSDDDYHVEVKCQDCGQLYDLDIERSVCFSSWSKSEESVE